MIRAVVLLPLLLCSCAFFRTATSPMPAVFHEAPSGAADTLVVLLPGLGDGPDDYVRHGFVDRIQEVRPRADVIAADAHFGYYRSRTFLTRLKEDVIRPVADRYDSIWLVGISLGGFGSAIFCKEYPGVIDGLILLAPYMGDDGVIGAVGRSGGLARWTPPADVALIADDAERKFHELWTFYRGYATGMSSEMPQLFLGWGTEDELHYPVGMVAAVLSPERVVARPGGHRWTVWQPLFDELVVRALAE